MKVPTIIKVRVCVPSVAIIAREQVLVNAKSTFSRISAFSTKGDVELWQHCTKGYFRYAKKGG